MLCSAKIRRNFTESNKLSDVRFLVEGKQVHVAKTVSEFYSFFNRQLHFFYLLAVHSPVFEAMLFGNFEETNKEELEIKEVKHKVGFYNFL